MSIRQPLCSTDGQRQGRRPLPFHPQSLQSHNPVSNFTSLSREICVSARNGPTSMLHATRKGTRCFSVFSAGDHSSFSAGRMSLYKAWTFGPKPSALYNYCRVDKGHNGRRYTTIAGWTKNTTEGGGHAHYWWRIFE